MSEVHPAVGVRVVVVVVFISVAAVPEPLVSYAAPIRVKLETGHMVTGVGFEPTASRL